MAKQMSQIWIGIDSKELRFDNSSHDSGKILSGKTVQIWTTPQIEFKPTMLCVRKKIAESFLIHGLYIGNQSATAGDGAIPADAFATEMEELEKIEEAFRHDNCVYVKVEKGNKETKIGMPWDMPKCFLGMRIGITIENVGEKEERFVAGILGRTDHIK